MKFSRVRPIVRKEFRQISRDGRSLAVLLVIPAFMLIMFGYALNLDVRDVRLGVMDEDGSSRSRELTSQFVNSEFFKLTAVVTDRHEVDKLIDSRAVRLVLIIPRGFHRSVERGDQASVQLLVDGANATSAATTIGYASAVVQGYSSRITAQALRRSVAGDVALPVDYRPRIWYNPELKSAKFLVPGLIGFILMITTVISTALSIVRERERGTMEQIVVSPIHPIELLIGKTIPYVLISLVSTSIILVTGYLLFDVVVQGSLFWLFVLTLLFIVAGLSVGLFVSTIAETQEAAFMISVTISLLPTFILSGFSFPIRNMPLPIQLVTYLNPARHFLTALRELILKGAGPTTFWPEMLFLALFAIFIATISRNKMERQLL